MTVCKASGIGFRDTEDKTLDDSLSFHGTIDCIQTSNGISLWGPLHGCLNKIKRWAGAEASPTCMKAARLIREASNLLDME